MTKLCTNCKTDKSVSDFYIKTSRKNEGYNYNDPCLYASECKSCQIKRQAEVRKNNKDLFKSRDLFQSFGIRFEEYKSIYDFQNGCCAVCERHSSEFSRALDVDHNHTTGEIRGLLCNLCNTGIGKFKDNVDLLEKCIKYLKKSGLAGKSNIVVRQLKKVG